MPISAIQHRQETQRVPGSNARRHRRIQTSTPSGIEKDIESFKIPFLADLEVIKNTPSEKRTVRYRQHSLQLSHMVGLALLLQNASLPMLVNAEPLATNNHKIKKVIHDRQLAPSRRLPHDSDNRLLSKDLHLHPGASYPQQSRGQLPQRSKRDSFPALSRSGSLSHHMISMSQASSLPNIIELNKNEVEKIFTSLTEINSSNLDSLGLTPIVFFSRREQVSTRSPRRALSEAIAEQEEKKLEYLRDNCHIRTKANNGTLIGDSLLVASEYARNPIRGLVENIEIKINPNYHPSALEVKLEEIANWGFDIILGVVTSGAYPIIKYTSAQGLKVIGHTVNGDKACVKYDFSPDEMANLLLNTDAGIVTHGVHIERPVQALPTELAISPSYAPAGLFYHEHTNTGLKREQHAVFTFQGDEYKIIENTAKEFVAISTSNPDDAQLQKHVFFNEQNHKIYFDRTFPAGQGIDYQLSPGAHFITIRGKHYPIFASSDTLPGENTYVVELIDSAGNKYMTPVYKEPLLNTWHLSVLNGQPVFDKSQRDIISEISLPLSQDHHYKPIKNLSPAHYGSGVIFEVSNKNDITEYRSYYVLEMNGVLVPVRMEPIEKHGIRYEIYSLKHPELPGHAIEWDGGRWRFEPPTSPSVSAQLIEAIHSEMYATQMAEHELSAPDLMGIKWNNQDNPYLKINNQYLELEQCHGNVFSITYHDGVLYIKYHEREFIPELIVDTSTCVANLLPRRVLRQTPGSPLLPYNKNCVAFTLSKISSNDVKTTVNLLMEKRYINTPSELQHNNVVTEVLRKLSMPKIIKDINYQEAKEILRSSPDGRYFAINTKKVPFDNNGQSHAFTIIMKKGSIGIAGNNAEVTNMPYNGVIQDTDYISVWGPIAQNTILNNNNTPIG